jgi:hypothetical protein
LLHCTISFLELQIHLSGRGSACRNVKSQNKISTEESNRREERHIFEVTIHIARISARTHTILTEVSRGFSQSLGKYWDNAPH